MINTQQADYAIGLDVLRRLVGPDADIGRLVFFVVSGDPKSKGRPRFDRRGHAYTPKETALNEARMAREFRQALGGVKFEESVAIAAVFFRPNYQRIDADNMMKLVLDAGTKAEAWIDDCYITAQSSYVELDRASPRTLVVLAPAKSSLDRTHRFTCTICDASFNRSGVAAYKRPPKFCSVECRRKGYDQDRAYAVCPKCDTGFRRARAAQRYCSTYCSTTDRILRPKVSEQRPAPTCQSCGGPVSRREYTRCSKCSPRGRTLGAKNQAKTPGAQFTVSPLTE